MKKENWEKEIKKHLPLIPGVITLKNEDRFWENCGLFSFIRQLLEKQREEILKIIQARLDYCQKKNGLPYCKNCGLCKEDIEKLNNQL